MPSSEKLGESEDGEDQDDVIFAEEKRKSYLIQNIQNDELSQQSCSTEYLDEAYKKSLYDKTTNKPMLVPRTSRKKSTSFASNFYTNECKNDEYSKKDVKEYDDVGSLFAKIYQSTLVKENEVDTDFITQKNTAYVSEKKRKSEESRTKDVLTASKNIYLGSQNEGMTHHATKFNVETHGKKQEPRTPPLSKIQKLIETPSTTNTDGRKKNTMQKISSVFTPEIIHLPRRSTEKGFEDETPSFVQNDHFLENNEDEYYKSRKKRKEYQNEFVKLSIAINRERAAVLQSARKMKNCGYIIHPKRKKHPITNKQVCDVQKKKSIVGSIPSHWAKHAHIKSNQVQMHSRNTAALSEATKSRMSKPFQKQSKTCITNLISSGLNQNHAMRSNAKDPPQLPQLESETRTTPEFHPTQQQPKLHSNQEEHQEQHNDNIHKQLQQSTLYNKDEECNLNVGSMRFRPALLKNDQVEVTENDYDSDNMNKITSFVSEERHMVSPRSTPSKYTHNESSPNNYYSTPTTKSRRRGKPIEGSLVKTMRSLRSKASADWVRLTSRTYPFGSQDINDPRNRSQLHIDVTIVSSPCKKNVGGQIYLLSYVHTLTHHATKKDNSHLVHLSKFSQLPSPTYLGFSSPQEDLPKISFSHEMPKFMAPSFALIYFTSETIRVQNILKGTQLRVYDCIFTKKSFCENSKTLPEILCTNLCEHYHQSLPPLSAVPNWNENDMIH